MRQWLRLGRHWLLILRDAGRLWLRHDAFSHAGALAFFALFSVAPTLIIAAAVIGAVLGEGAAQGEIVAQLQETIGAEAAATIEQVVLMSRVAASGLPTLLGIGALLIGASVFGAAASLVIVLFWVYYSALILLLGAAFTRAHLEARGRPVVPRPSAVKVVEELLSG